MVDVKELRKFELFADLDSKQFGKIAKIASFEKVEAGGEVFAEDEEATTLYLVSAGKVVLRMKSRKGQDVVVGEVGPGELFGWSAVLEDRTFTAAAVTVEDSTLVAFDGEQLRSLLTENYGLGYRVSSSIAIIVSRRLANLRSRLVDEPFAAEELARPAELRRFEIFADLDNNELEEIAKIASVKRVEPGCDVLRENEEATTLYLILAGKAAVRMRSRKGQEAVVEEVGPGELFGWSSVLGDRAFVAAVQTVEDSTLVAFEGKQFRRLLAENQRLGYQVMSSIAAVISGRLGNLRSRLVDEPFAAEELPSPVQEEHIGPPAAGPASEMRSMACPDCGAVNRPQAIVNETEQYRCRNCGMVFYSPVGCETTESTR